MIYSSYTSTALKIHLTDDNYFRHISRFRIKVNDPNCVFGLKYIPYLVYVITMEGIKPDPNKVKGIVDIGQPAFTTEERALIGMFHYYRDMWTSQSHILAPLKEAANVPKGRKIFWNDALDNSFKQLNRMVSADTLISDPDWKMPFTVHTDAYDKQLGSVIINNTKHIVLFSRRLSNLYHNYTTTEREILALVEFFNKFQGILFGCDINVF